MDKRLGFQGGGETQWPEVSISGLEYSRPITTVGVGNGYFVVIDIFPTVDWQGEMELLREQVKAMGDEPKRTGKKSESL